MKTKIGPMNKLIVVALFALSLVAWFIFIRFGHIHEGDMLSLEKDRKIKEFQTYETHDSKCGDYSFRNIYSYKSSKWELVNNVCKDCFRFVKSRLNTPSGTVPIYVYEAKDDVYISASIIQTGKFDKAKLIQHLQIFKTDPSLNFIDIGANIGVFSLSVAQFGRKVIAIEALKSNVQHLCFSIKDGGFQNNLTVIFNALSDRTGMDVKLGVDVNNMGGTFVDFDSDNTRKVKKSYNLRLGGSYGTVSTVTLDNLLDFEKISEFKNVLIKMDIEGFEYKALLGAKKFFDTINIRAVFMEWVFHKNKETGKGIIDFMTKRNYEPYSEDGNHVLTNVDQGQWPLNILWLPEK